MTPFKAYLWLYILTPLIEAMIIPFGVFLLAGVLYLAGGTVTADSLEEGGLLTLGFYVLMFFMFVFRQVYAYRRIKKKTGLSLEEFRKLSKEEQERIFKKHSGV